MAVLTVVCFIALSAGFVSVSGDADAADGIKVVSYDSREGQNGQLVLDAGLDAGNYSATIGSITYLGTCDPLTGIVTLSNPSDKAGTLSAGSYQVKLKNVDTKADEGTFTLNVFEVVFDPNGGTGNIDSIVAYGSVPAPDSKGLSNDGKTFLGWSKTRDATVAEFTDTLFVDSSFVLYAVWGSAAPQTYTITFDTDGGSEVAPITQDFGTAVTAPAAPTKEGYTFVKWEPSVPTTMPAENTTVKAVWKVNQYAVTVNVNDSSMGSYTLTVDGADISSGDSVEYGKTVMLSIVQNEGYKLKLLKDNNKEVDPDVLSYSFKVKEAHEIDIEFAATSEFSYIVTISCGEGGSISPAPEEGKYTLCGG